MNLSLDGFMTRLNPLLSAWLRLPLLHWLLSPGLMLLTVTGRVSGRPHTFPVGYQRDGNELTVMVSEARKKRWWRNLREPAAVELLLRGRWLSGSAALVAPSSPEFARRAEETLRRVPAMRRVFRVDFDPEAGLTRDQLAQLADEIRVVRIQLEDHSLTSGGRSH